MLGAPSGGLLGGGLAAHYWLYGPGSDLESAVDAPKPTLRLGSCCRHPHACSPRQSRLRRLSGPQTAGMSWWKLCEMTPPLHDCIQPARKTVCSVPILSPSLSGTSGSRTERKKSRTGSYPGRVAGTGEPRGHPRERAEGLGEKNSSAANCAPWMQWARPAFFVGVTFQKALRDKGCLAPSAQPPRRLARLRCHPRMRRHAAHAGVMTPPIMASSTAAPHLGGMQSISWGDLGPIGAIIYILSSHPGAGGRRRVVHLLDAL